MFFLFFTLSNFTKLDDNFFNKKINLGLDLQGGSYLLLEIDNKPVITKELQNKITFLKTYFKDKNINIFNLKTYNQNSIRDVIPFPKTQSGLDPLTDAPSYISENILEEYNLKYINKDE